MFGYVQDAYTKGRLTVNAGLRFDYQDDQALSSSVPANALIPELLPAANFAGADAGIQFNDWSPRLGATYDLSNDGKTVIKGNYAVYWGTGISTAASLNPVSEVSLRYPWTDTNRDTFVQRSELDLTRLLNRSGNYDPANPSSPVSSTTVDPNFKNDRTTEYSIGLERELMANFGVGAAYIYRTYPDYENFTATNGVRSEDYVPVTFTANCGNTISRRIPRRITSCRLRCRAPARAATPIARASTTGSS